MSKKSGKSQRRGGRDKNKKVHIAGDFNFDLLKTSTHNDTSSFYDKISSNLFIPLISLPTRINSRNNTLIDNIFTNQFNPATISGNLTIDISDHLASFIITPKPNQKHLPKKHNIYTRDTNNFDRANFIMDILDIDWNSDNDANASFNNFLDKTNKIIDEYMPLRKLTNREYKRRYKPWITDGLIISINRKNRIFNRYSKTKDPINKQQLHSEYKTLRNTINKLLQTSKNNYYKSFFAEHNNNIKKVWQGIKEIVNIKSTPISFLKSIIKQLLRN